jgi:hypothetical protein
LADLAIVIGVDGVKTYTAGELTILIVLEPYGNLTVTLG